MSLRVAVMGGTGLVGRALLRRLASDPDFGPVVALGRRPVGVPGVLDVPVDAPRAADVPEGTDAAFCCLGTTLRKAGSQEAFRAVDHGLVLAFARACRERGVRQLHVVSAMSAREGSPVFYSRVKGEMERDVRALGYPVACVYRPSLLLGERAERRPGERVGIAVSKVMGPVLPRAWRGIPAEVVAGAMARRAKDAPEGFHVHGSGELWTLGREG